MTILVGFSASRQSDAPINLAKQIAESAGEPAVAAAIIERPWPPRGDPVEKEYLEYRTEQVRNSLNQVARKLPGETVPAVVHESSSVPTGLIELAAELNASLVVVGSSSSGLLGRVALGSVTGRLVHTAAVPVAIAPRGYAVQPIGLRRISASYGGEADINGLVGAAAELAKKWSVTLRIVSFTVRPSSPFGGRPNTGAEDLVVEQWARRTHDEISRQLDSARTLSPRRMLRWWWAAVPTGVMPWNRSAGNPATSWRWGRAPQDRPRRCSWARPHLRSSGIRPCR